MNQPFYYQETVPFVPFLAFVTFASQAWANKEEGPGADDNLSYFLNDMTMVTRIGV